MRHTTHPQAAEFGPDDMSARYNARDLLVGQRQTIITADLALDQSMAMIMEISGLSPCDPSQTTIVWAQVGPTPGMTTV